MEHLLQRPGSASWAGAQSKTRGPDDDVDATVGLEHAVERAAASPRVRDVDRWNAVAAGGSGGDETVRSRPRDELVAEVGELTAIAVPMSLDLR